MYSSSIQSGAMPTSALIAASSPAARRLDARARTMASTIGRPGTQFRPVAGAGPTARCHGSSVWIRRRVRSRNCKIGCLNDRIGIFVVIVHEIISCIILNYQLEHFVLCIWPKTDSISNFVSLYNFKTISISRVVVSNKMIVLRL